LLLLLLSNGFITYTFHDLGIPTISVALGTIRINRYFTSPYTGRALANITFVWDANGSLSIEVLVEINNASKLVFFREKPETASFEVFLQENNSFSLTINVVGPGRFILYNSSVIKFVPLEGNAGEDSIWKRTMLLFITLASIAVPICIRILQLIKLREGGIVIVEDEK